MTKHESKEIGTMIQLAIERLKEHFRGSGCGSSVGCFKGKEIQTFLDGKLRSDIFDLVKHNEILQNQIKESEEKLREVEDMNKEGVLQLGAMEKNVNNLSASWARFPLKLMLCIVAANTISFGAIIGLIKLLNLG